MLACACGYTCGTRSAWRRHVDKFVDTDEAQDHVQVLLVESGGRAGGLQSGPPESPHAPLPLDLADDPEALGRTLSLGSTAASPLHRSPSGGEAAMLKTPTGFLSPKTPARSPTRQPFMSATFTHLPWILRRDRDGASNASSSRGRRSSSDEAGDTPLGTRTCPSLEGPGLPDPCPSPSSWASAARARLCPRLAGQAAEAGAVRRQPHGDPGGRRLRLLLVRHAQSANKCSESRRLAGKMKEADPELSRLGYEQANALVSKLKTLVGDQHDSRRLLVVSSPMRRCLLTIQPLVQKLQLPPGSTFCHGRCYEFGCAGTAQPGSSAETIRFDFPEFEPVGFSTAGTWDYRGDNVKETEPECRDRGLAIAEWLREEAPGLVEVADGSPSGATPTIILCIHQTISDLLCQILVDGTAKRWEYGEIRYGLHNTGITELFLHGDGSATFGLRDDCLHASGAAAAHSTRRRSAG